MRSRATDVDRPYHAPEPEYTVLGTVLATVTMLAAMFLVLLAASAPGAAATIVVAAVAVYTTGRTLLRRHRGRTRTVCLPRTDVCVVV